ncbi:uncharacterized protein LOC133304161 [Gastrolobium bilobum]|uniref:uncharacterized protein LOC133304161 n=1 Tax=Gastrolobium bilobum TaxID=150636 RepID=UPI002AB11B0C|nr:uncharacterized protein LOC133304161 [Gastrolobium bilobum]
MGCHQQAMVSGFMPNGLLPNEATSANLVLDQGRWSLAEERSAQLIEHIQPNQPSEEHRNAVSSYVQRLIMKCFSCEVFTFGSVPLKTYLPDGDIDLTAFSSNQTFKDSWVQKVRDIFESEEKREDAEFRVKEVQCIQAEVKIIKCLVENIVVDISFNQLGGLCTLCFLEEVDNLIRRNHIFKRSIILIKAWCYYESRILGASHGLISTYALETLVLYIFNVYNNTFAGPLEVLYRFLEFFSKFDWDNYCLSLWGPVPIRSLPNIRAEPPLKDCRELLLDNSFLNACNTFYGVMPSSQENQEQPFVCRYFNIIDPLRANNNLGRSVSKGSHFRIRKAFAFGAQQLVRLLDCPEENLIAEFDLFFRNTWDRHRNGHRPDAPSSGLNSRNKYVVKNSACNEAEDEHPQASHASHDIYKKTGDHSTGAKEIFGTSYISAVSRTQSPNTNGIFTGTMTSDIKHESSMKNAHPGKSQIPDYSSNEVHVTHHFDRALSLPEFAHISVEGPPRHRHIGVSEMEKGHNHSRSKVLANHNDSVSAENQQQTLYDWRSNDAAESKNASNSYNAEFGLGVIKEDGHSVDKAMWMHQKGQDFMNITETYRNFSSNGYLQAPVNVNLSNVPFPVPSAVSASGFAHANSFAMHSANAPSFESFWGCNMPYSQDLVPFPALQWFPSVGVPLNQEEINEPVDDNVVLAYLDHDDSDGGFWSNDNMNAVGGYDYEDGYIQAQQQRDRKMVTTECSSTGNPSWLTSSGSYLPKDYEPTIEHRMLTSENTSDGLLDKRNMGNCINSTASSRSMCSTSSSKLSSSTFSNKSPSKAPKLKKDQRALKSAFPTPPFSVYESQREGKHIDHISAQPDDDSGERICQATIGTDLAECTTAEAVTSDVQNHQSANYRQGPMNVSNSNVPNIPVLVGPGSSQRAVDNQELLPFAFHPAGSPVPFNTMYMFPLYYLPHETGTPYTATNCMDMEAELGNLHAYQSVFSLDSTERIKQLDTFHKSNNIIYEESLVKQRPDILHGDFRSYWLNLQYGRFCQNAQLLRPSSYPSYDVPPIYIQGQFPWDGPGRPSSNMNMMAHAPPLVPMMSIRCGSDSHVGVNQLYAGELPRYSGGTGTYLPNPKYYRCMHSNNRNQRGNYNFGQKDRPWEREGNWNFNSKSRFASRDQFYYQVERPGIRMDKSNLSNRRPDRPWNSFKRGSFYRGKLYNDSHNTSTPNDHVADLPYGIRPPPVSAARFSGTNEATHQGKDSHNAINGLAKFKRDSAESYLDRHSSSHNFGGVQKD